MTFSSADQAFMQEALRLARAQLGQTAPNPAVGCVIVRNGEIIGSGATAPGGRPHAETQALEQTQDARGATAYVTLEPCAHHGKTPPCAEALIKAGLARVVIACTDPDPRVNSGGIALLRQAGLTVEAGVGEAEAKEINRGFFLRVSTGRPFITLKLATSLDGMIATKTGESKWITGTDARAEGHRERASHDAILTGIGTILADDPQLNVRLPGHTHQPVRIVLDSKLRLPPSSRIVQSAKEQPVWVFGSGPNPPADVDIISGIAPYDLKAVMGKLAERGLTRVMVEGGGRILSSFLRTGLFDRIVWFRAPTLIGADGVPAIGPMELQHLKDRLNLRRTEIRELGDDMMEIYEKD